MLCLVTDCTDSVRSLGMCQRHYLAEYRQRPTAKASARTRNREWARLNMATRPDLKAKQREAHRTYRRRPEVMAKHAADEKTRYRLLGGKQHRRLLRSLLFHQMGVCGDAQKDPQRWGCGQPLDEGSAHVDHIVPVSAGGGNEPENLQALCAFCNISKGAKVVREPVRSAA